MRFWFDTEFIEDGKTIDLLSIGIVSADGREYYAENVEANFHLAGDWVKQNVFPHLGKAVGAPKTRPTIAREIVEFVGEKPEFWAYYASYDWVALCQLYGKMIDLPDGWPMFVRDVKQLCDMGNNQALLPLKLGGEHHALNDARWTRVAWEILNAR